MLPKVSLAKNNIAEPLYLSGGEPKLAWTKNAPCTKLYTNGKHSIRGPLPEGFQMTLTEIYESEAGYQQWITKLETCQP